MSVVGFRTAPIFLLVFGCAATPTEGSTDVEYFPSSSDDHPQPTFATTTSSLTDSSPTTADTAGESSTATTSTVSSTGIVPDFGEGEQSCNGKIDFLFVINRAHYMGPYWNRFHAAFPGFIEDVFETFVNYDMHFMAVDGIQGWGVYDCIEPCKQTNGTCQQIPDFPCDPYLNDTISECDEISGAGVVFPAGVNAANQDCGAIEGRRYIASDQPGAMESVKCIGQMGYGLMGTWAYATTAMLQAVSKGTPAWECNGDFLREDAMLVVVYFEEPDAPKCTPSPPGEWAAILSEAKGGDEDSLLFIGLIDDSSSDAPTVCPGGSGAYGTCPEAFLHYYVRHRVEGSYCADDYSPYFAEGLELLEALCDPNIPT